MKQYLNSEQTAKLMGLGFEKPKNERWVLDVANESTPSIQNLVKRQDYSIGELIEMLPDAICESHDDSCHYHLSMDTDACMWRVRYIDDFDVTLCATYDVDLINALYDVCVKLKEEGVI